MPFTIRPIESQSQWQKAENQLKPQSFLQSWSWGKFQETMGNKIWRLGIYENDNLIGTALVTKISAKRGTFLLIQHGPNLDKTDQKIFSSFLAELKRIGEREKADFIRISPLLERNQKNQALFKNLGFREAPMHANAYEATWKLDIAPPEEELLGSMRKTTRYLIKQALKNPDITVEARLDAQALNDYQKLNQTVAKKQSFTPFSEEYIKNEFEIFSKEGQALLFLGSFKGELAAAALVIFWQGAAYYHQAASGFKYAKLSIPYLIAWEAIKEARRRNCALFDFWGYTNPKANPKHPWAGPTLFKMGFGGLPYEYLKTQDFPLSKKYWLNYLIEQARKIKRGY